MRKQWMAVKSSVASFYNGAKGMCVIRLKYSVIRIISLIDWCYHSLGRTKDLNVLVNWDG